MTARPVLGATNRTMDVWTPGTERTRRARDWGHRPFSQPLSGLCYTPRVNPYRSLFKALNAAGIRYIVVGGVAVNLHGYARFTGDVDVLLALDAANLQKIAALMGSLGYAQRLPIDVRALSDRKQVQQWMTEKGMTAYTFINPSLPQFSLDILAGESIDFARYDRNKVVIEAWDVPIPVVSLNDLIEMKRKVDREKDAEDVAALLQLKSL